MLEGFENVDLKENVKDQLDSESHKSRSVKHNS